VLLGCVPPDRLGDRGSPLLQVPARAADSVAARHFHNAAPCKPQGARLCCRGFGWRAATRGGDT
jgi:hypothetical protein